MIDIALEGTSSTFREIEDILALVRSDLETHLATLSLHPETEVSVVLTDDANIQELNAKWKGEDSPTDVLSFPQFERGEIPDGIPVAIGDIVVSLERAEAIVERGNHRERIERALGSKTPAWSLEHEVSFLVIHALLHLVGYDHHDDDAEREMLEMEKTLWLGKNSLS